MEQYNARELSFEGREQNIVPSRKQETVARLYLLSYIVVYGLEENDGNYNLVHLQYRFFNWFSKMHH